MRIIPFPQPNTPRGEQTLTEIEAALHHDAPGTNAHAWRQLRNDVRSLAPPMSPELEQELRRRIGARLSLSAPSAHSRPRPRVRARAARLNGWLASGPRARLLALSGASVAAVVVTLVVLAPWRPTNEFHAGISKASSRAEQLGVAQPVVSAAAHASKGTAAAAGESSAATPVVAETLAPTAGRRVQQLGATLTLAAKPEAVQSVADQVARLAAREGGFVQSSQVQVQAGKPGEASLSLSLPSERLSAALTQLDRLAPMRAESQSLQDITSEYEAAKRKLGDDVAERQALLRALGRASTQGEIESIHARLSLVGGAITRDRAALQSVTKRGSNSTVEVTVLGNAHAGNGGLTLSRGLHDAGDVLRVALAVLIITLAVLVPLALLLGLGALGLRGTRRRLRERALS